MGVDASLLRCALQSPILVSVSVRVLIRAVAVAGSSGAAAATRSRGADAGPAGRIADGMIHHTNTATRRRRCRD